MDWGSVIYIYSFEIQHENEAMSTVYKSFCMEVRNVMYSDVIIVKEYYIP